jgi:hypothetical protein
VYKKKKHVFCGNLLQNQVLIFGPTNSRVLGLLGIGHMKVMLGLDRLDVFVNQLPPVQWKQHPNPFHPEKRDIFMPFSRSKISMG